MVLFKDPIAPASQSPLLLIGLSWTQSLQPMGPSGHSTCKTPHFFLSRTGHRTQDLMHAKCSASVGRPFKEISSWSQLKKRVNYSPLSQSLRVQETHGANKSGGRTGGDSKGGGRERGWGPEGSRHCPCTSPQGWWLHGIG